MDVANNAQLFETDEHQWMLDQIALLQAGKYEALDHGNLVQYLTEMTIRDRRELESRFVVLLRHMLKFAVQPTRASRNWSSTIVAQQDEIQAMIKGTPSLKTYQQSLFAEAFPRAVRLAASETRIPQAKFPSACPWSVEEALGFEPPDVP